MYSINNIQKQTNYAKGVAFEKLAANILKQHGFDIIGNRVRNKYGEIDLIAQKGIDIIAVEVKQRKTLSTSLECISKRQQIRIANAFAMFISERVNNKFENYRIDVVCFDKNGMYEYIENAFSINT